MLDMSEIRELIRLLDDSSLAEIRIEYEDLKLHLKKYSDVAALGSVATHTAGVLPTQHPSPAAPGGAGQEVAPVASPAQNSPSDEGLHVIASPMVGTFYRSPSPDAPVFVEEGSRVTSKSVLCIVEAMKLMNEIEAEVSGEVVEVLAQNGELIEYGQPLFKIRLT